MPRMMTKELPAFCVWTKLTLGVSAMKSAGRSIPALVIASEVKAVTAAGVS
jgi:hypothetical protein